jgi:hypothetical protein
MPLPSVFLIHSATLTAKQQQFTLAYDNGTAAFTAGKTLTGATSNATAIIVSTGTVASGTLTLHTISGTFLNDEAISDNGTVPGAARVNGTIAEKFDTNGELVYSDVATTISCRFVGPQESMRVGSRNVPYIVSTPRVLLPSGTAVSEGDTITSTETGFNGTFRVNSVKQTYEAAQKIVSHITCEIAAVGATGGA